MVRLILLFFTILLVTTRAFPDLAQGKNQGKVKDTQIENAVIFIEVTTQSGDWYSPWQQARTTGVSGSGFLIGPGLVLTNAHIVSDTKQIIVRRNGLSTPFFAEVEFIAHDSDLALLKIKDESFFKGVKPLLLGGLPSLQTRVRTYGYPAGGEKISRTEGVVSRIQFITYHHSGADAHLAIQTDSAINPGNSGGPVMQEGKVVGVAFQANANLNDVGYFIPTSVIKRFLKDIKDGRYDGYPELGLVTSNLINPVYRDFLKLKDKITGVVVDSVIPGTSAAGFIKPEDVITAINNIPIRNDGTVIYQGHSLNFQQISEENQVGDIVSFSVLREGKLRKISFPMLYFTDGDRLRSSFDIQPPYYIFAGLVFMKLDQEFLNTFGNYWKNARKDLLYNHFYLQTEEPTSEQRETILLTRILPHQINSAYRNRINSIVSKINGMEITKLSDLPKAFKNGKDEFHQIVLEDSGFVIVLERDKARKAHDEILQIYGIPKDRRLP